MYKVGDIVRVSGNHTWFSYSSDNYHNVRSGEVFSIINYKNPLIGVFEYVELVNIELGYELSIPLSTFDKFFNLRKLRKEKLEKLCCSR